MPLDVTATMKRLGGTARTLDLRAAGVHPRDLYAARDSGDIVALARGVWTLPETAWVDPDLAALTLRMPDVVFGAMTALVLHDLTDEVPADIHVILRHGRHPPRIPGISVVAYHVSPNRLVRGIETRSLGDLQVRLTDIPRTIVDAFKYRSRLGATVGRDALREALARGLATPSEIATAAEEAGVATVVRPVLEALT